MTIDKLLPQLLSWITNARREKVEIQWSSESWTHNVFRFYELIFWRRSGIKAESSTISEVNEDGIQTITRACHSWESVFALAETAIRQFLKTWRPVPIRIYIPMLATPQGMPVFASPYLLAVAYDNATVNLSVSSATNSYSHTCTGSSLLLWNGVFDTSGDINSGETYNAVSLTQADKRPNGSEEVYLHYLIAPATGAHTMATSFSGSTISRSHTASYSGCKQSGVPDAFTDGSPNTSSSATATLTTIADNCWAVLFVRGGVDVVASTNSTERPSAAGSTSAIFDTNGAKTPAGSLSMSFTDTGSGSNTYIMASFAPVGGTLHTQTLTESISNSDKIAKGIGLIAEAISNSDTLIRSMSRSLTEAITNSDLFGRFQSEILSESVSLKDIFSRTNTTGQGPDSSATQADDSSSGGSIAWINPTNAAASDSTYTTATLTSPQFSHYLDVTNFGFAIPTNATVTGLLVEVKAHRDAFDCRSLYAKIIKGGSIGTTNRAANSLNSIDTTDSYKPYGSATDLWGLSWTPSDINASNFGFAFAVQPQSGSGTVYVDHIRITVFYSVSGNIFSQALTESISQTSSLLHTTARGFNEAISNTDALARSIVRSFLEAITNSDTFASARTLVAALVEAVTQGDALIRKAGAVLSEALSSTDVIVRTTARKFTEALSNGDILARSTGRSLAEAAANSDTFTSLRGKGAALTEALSNTDKFVRSLVRTFIEAISSTDTFAGATGAFAILSEAINYTDTRITAAGKALSEAISQADTFRRNVARTLSDAITSADTFAAVRFRLANLAEAISNTDALIRSTGRSFVEAVANSDTFIAAKTFLRSYTEAITNSDTLLRLTGRAIMEVVALTDVFSRIGTFGRVFTETTTLTDTSRYLLNGSVVIWHNLRNKAATAWSMATKAVTSFTDKQKADTNWTNKNKSS